MVALLSAFIAFWPVWTWYCERIYSNGDDSLGVIALLTMAVLTWLRQSQIRLSANKLHFGPGTANAKQLPNDFINGSDEIAVRGDSGWRLKGLRILLTSSLLVLLYCCSLLWPLPLIQAPIALIVLGCVCKSTLLNKFTAGDWLLLMLSLPVMASIDFYGGYPLRVMACNVASIMLNLGGLAVTTHGTEIVSNNAIVGIDPPCSGIKMLWVAVYLASTLCSLRALSHWSTFRVLFFSIVAALAANALRVSSLFYVESGLIQVPKFFHELIHAGVGAAVFALSAFLIFRLAVSESKILYKRGPVEMETLPPFLTSEVQSEVLTLNNGWDILSDTSQLILALQNRGGLQDWSVSGSRNSPTMRGTIPVVFTTAGSKIIQPISSLAVFVVCCSLAATMPLVIKQTAAVTTTARFEGWPELFEGHSLKVIPLSDLNRRFAQGFPGKIAVFSTGTARVVFRWVPQPTRQLHAASNCYHAGGYQITWLPQYLDGQDNRWAAFEAARDGERFRIRERIYDQTGQSWTDVSSWYWAALLNKSSSPWWSVSVAERVVD